jgi:hypothetical protein
MPAVMSASYVVAKFVHHLFQMEIGFRIEAVVCPGIIILPGNGNCPS